MCNKQDGGANNEKGVAGLLKFWVLGWHPSMPNTAARRFCFPVLLFWFGRKPCKGLNAFLFGTQTKTEAGHSPEWFWTCLDVAGNPFIPRGNYQEMCNGSHRDWDKMACVPHHFDAWLWHPALSGKERAFLNGTKCHSPQLGSPGHGQGWAALGGWVREGRLIFTLLSTPDMGARERWAQPDSLCSAALQEGKARWGFGHLQPPSVALSTSAWGWSSCYHHE